MAGRVVVVGSINIDLVVTVERLPGPGETVTGGRFARHHGGKGANQAVAAARLGVRTTFVGAVGADEHGDLARAALAAEGVDAARLLTDPAAPTGVALIVVATGGENQIAVASGANGALTAAQVGEALEALELGSGDVLLTGLEIPIEAAREALRLGRAAGARTILNPAPAGGLDRATFGLADILTPNRVELATIAAAEGRRVGRISTRGGTDTGPAARSLVERNAEGEGVREAVLVTLGPAGAVLVSRDGRSIEVPALSVRAVDAVGAGDAVNGALAAGLAGGLDLAEAVRQAVAAGCLAVTRDGARQGLPTRAELHAFLEGAER